MQLRNFVRSNCNSASGSPVFDLQFEVHFRNAPAGEALVVQLDGANVGTIPAGSPSPQALTLNNQPADGSTYHTLTAAFAISTGCATLSRVSYPVPCVPDMPLYTGGPGIGGRVFKDFDRNAIDDGVGGWSGVTVIAYDADNNVVDVAYTDGDGDYLLDGVNSGVPYRVEFVLPAIYGALSATSSATAHHRLINFVTADARVDLGLSVSTDYLAPDARVFTACYVNGDPTLPGTSGSMDWAVQYPYTAPANDGLNEYVATGEVMGATWGMAHQAASDYAYAAPVAKRHSGFGTGGPGTIYRIDMTQSPPVVTEYFNIEDFGYSAGVDPRVPGDMTGTATDLNRDSAMFDGVGKMAWGDLDLSEDQRTLWAVNLHDRHLYEVSIGLYGNAVGAGSIKRHAIPDPGCTDGEFRPWAVDVEHGRVYVGGVCSGESGDTTSAKLRAFVYSHDPQGPDGNFTHEIDFSLQYPRGFVSGQLNDPAEWRPWIDEWSDIINPLPNQGSYSQTIYPQPILSDIDFDETGAMVLGFIDRMGHQGGNRNYSPVPGDTERYEIASAGDILRLAHDGTQWQLENNGSVGGVTSMGAASTGDMGPGGAEFYWGEHYQYNNSNPDAGGHQETSLGGIAIAKGTGEVALTVFDPLSAYRAAGSIWLSHTSGAQTNAYEVFGQDAGGQPVTFGKAAGLGDMEIRSKLPPIEIGNRVWYDTDRNGRQDAGEPPLPGVRMTLFNQAGDSLATVTTDAEGYYGFDEATLRASSYTADTVLRVASTYYVVAAAGQFDPNTQRLRDTLLLTPADTDNNRRDSDGKLATGSIAPGYPIAPAYTNEGTNDYRTDFGFQRYCPVTVIDTVAVCQDNGTPLNGLDDYYLLSVIAQPYAGVAADTFELVRDANPDGTGGTVLGTAAPGQSVTIGQDRSLVTGGGTTITVRHRNDAGCAAVFTPGPLPDCKTCGLQCLGPISITRTFD